MVCIKLIRGSLNGSIKSYNWNFQDGTTDTGKIVNHKFINEGIYRVKLTVTDNDNNSTSTVISQAAPRRSERYRNDSNFICLQT